MKIKLLAISLFALCAILSSCTCARKTDVDKDSKTLHYSTNAAPTTLDPVQSATLYTNLMVTAIFDTLYEYKYLKRPFELKPSLAIDMPKISSDGLTYTIEIKKGVMFHDDPAFPDGTGREVTAQDVVYSIKRSFDPATRPEGTWLWQNRIVGLDAWGDNGADYDKEVEGLKTLDRHTIQIKLTQNYPQFIYTLAMGFSAVVAREVVEKYGREITINAVGSGPWMLKSFSTQRALLQRNPNYRREIMDIEGYDSDIHGFTGIGKLKGRTIPMLDFVEISFMQEHITRWNSFIKGDEVQNTTIPVEQFDHVAQSKDPFVLKPEFAKKYHGRLESDFGYVYTNFNMDDERIGYSDNPEQNKRNRALRCAIRKAWNWPERIERFYNGIGEAFPGIIPRGIDGYDPNMSRESVTRDVEGAKKLLAEYGWTTENLPVLENHGVSSVRMTQFYEQERGWLTEIGYPRDKIRQVTYATFGDYVGAVRNRRAMLIGMGWGLDYPDSENVLQLYYGPHKSPGSNSSNYDNPEYNKLFEQAKVMQPSPARTEIYKKLNQMIVDDCVAISGFSRTHPLVWHKNVLMYHTTNVLGNIFKYVYVE